MMRPERSVYRYRIAGADWGRANVSPDARIGSWNAGAFGYFVDGHVICLDGLVNDVAYARRMIARTPLDDYFESERITWLGDQACGVAPRPKGYLWRSRSDHLDSRFETAATFAAANLDHCPGFAVWRMGEGAGNE